MNGKSTAVEPVRQTLGHRVMEKMNKECVRLSEATARLNDRLKSVLSEVERAQRPKDPEPPQPIYPPLIQSIAIFSGEVERTADTIEDILSKLEI